MIGTVIFIIVGIIILTIGINYRIKSEKSENWKSTSGEIINTRLARMDMIDNHHLICEVEYSFIIDNRIIVGNKITPYTKIDGDDINIRIYEKLKEAKKVQVYYNPKNVNESCLVNGKNYLSMSYIFLGLTILLFSVFMLYLGLEQGVKDEIEFVK